MKFGYIIAMVVYLIGFLYITNFNPVQLEIVIFLSTLMILVMIGILSAKINPSPELMNVIEDYNRMSKIKVNVFPTEDKEKVSP
jgi:hypothetical protein